jgi:SAM-dependent methyltransferase
MHLSECPACDSSRHTALFGFRGSQVQRCEECDLVFLNPQPPAVSSPSVTFSKTRDDRSYSCSTTEVTSQPEASFDVCICTDVVDRVRQPVALLNDLHRALKPGGELRLVTSIVDGTSARSLRRALAAAPIERLHHFSRATMLNVMARAGFREVEFTTDGGRLTAIGRAHPQRPRPVVSVIVPAYNEAGTIRAVLDRLLAKRVDGLDKEIIVVESNSTDGTRDVVTAYQGRAGVQVILADRPRGKGHAVRQGLACATGDFVLIQDADDEYDINDYDALLEPLRRFRRAFVLGTRHKGHWRIRNFGASGSVTAYMNLGHIFLTEFFNLLYAQTLSDPWTMYKVFRRDCVHRLRLECNRFDFDVELVAKLVRRGFSPLEIPVHYHSRSFSEGKKIRVLRDPITWIWACLKYRVARLDSKPS